MDTNYGSAQVGHLYFLGSELQTPHSTSAILSISDCSRQKVLQGFSDSSYRARESITMY